MKLAQLIQQAELRVAQLVTERSPHTDVIEAVRAACIAGNRNPTPDESAQVTAAIAARQPSDSALATARAELAELNREQAADDAADALTRQTHPTAVGRAREREARDMTTSYRVGAERHTYTPEGDSPSFLQDIFRAQVLNDPDAAARLSRHAREIEVDHGLSERALTTGGVQAFVPPAYLQSDWAEYARAGRPAVELTRKLPLPSTGMSVNLPKLSTGTTAAAQTAQNTAVSETNADDTQLTASVVTVAGQQTLSRQLLERSDPGMDQVIWGDLMEAYAAALDVEVLNGSGAGHATGILNVSGINAITYTDATPTLAELYPKLADSVQQVTGGRFKPPTAWVMHPRRWAWMLAALDSQSRPIVVPEGHQGQNALGMGTEVTGYGTTVGTLLGLPVVVDANVPTNLGAGTNEDRIILARWEDLFTFEDNGGAPHTIQAEQPNAASLSVLMVLYGYFAFMGDRQPKAISVVGGTGLVTPSF